MMILKFNFKKLKTFFLVGQFEIFFIIFCVLFYPGPVFYSIDGMYYFVQLISIFEDGDLYIYNNFDNFPLDIHVLTNQWSFGPALFWAPFYVVGHLIYDPCIYIYYLLTGYYPEYMLIFWFNIGLVNLGTIFYSYLGLKILGKALQKYFKIKFPVIIVQISILLCTSLIYFLFDRPLMSHSISFFMISVLVYLWVNWHDSLNMKQTWWVFFALGLATLVRYQNILYGVIFLPQVSNTFKEQWRERKTTLHFFKISLIKMLIALVSIFIGYTPQIIALWLQFGFGTMTPQDYYRHEFRVLNPDFYETWFGLRNGFFVWHPITCIFMLGLFFFFIQKNRNNLDAFVFLFAFLLQSYMWAIYNPTAEPGFGQRGLIDSYPLLAFGFFNFILLINKKISKMNRKVNSKKISSVLFYSIVIFLTVPNLYLFALTGHVYGPGWPLWYAPLDWLWENYGIDWNLVYEAFILNIFITEIYRVIILIAIGYLVISTNSIINYFCANSEKILLKIENLKNKIHHKLFKYH